MPYIVILNMPGCLPEQDPYVVATIEEAREAANNELRRGTHHGTIDYLPDAAELPPEHGGVIGPLPDGYVIDVQYRTWLELRDMLGYITVGAYPAPSEQEAMLAAYND